MSTIHKNIVQLIGTKWFGKWAKNSGKVREKIEDKSGNSVL